jgi:hypothetical protein
MTGKKWGMKYFKVVCMVIFSALCLGIAPSCGSDDDDGDWVEEVRGDGDIAVAGDTTEPRTFPGVPDTTVAAAPFCEGLAKAKEGDIGFWHRGGTECYPEDVGPFAGDEIHVSPQGTEGGDGSEGDPLNKVATAICGALPGQTVIVHPGTYHETVLLGGFGSADKPITIRGITEDGEEPVMDGGGCLTVGMLLIESQNFVIEDLVFRHYTDEGLYVANTSNVTIQGCLFEKNGFESVAPDFQQEGFGLTVGSSSNVTIKNNETAYNGPKPSVFAQAVLGMGIDTFELSDAEITGNNVHHTVGGGILVEEGVNVLVDGNDIHHNYLYAAGDYWDGGIWVDGGHHVTLTNNTITDNVGPAIQVSDADAKFPYFSCHYTVTDNTLTGNYWSLYIMNFGVCPMPPEIVLNYADNNSSDNTYPGTDWAAAATSDGEFLCEDWPCGDHAGCTDDEFDTSVKNCE